MAGFADSDDGKGVDPRSGATTAAAVSSRHANARSNRRPAVCRCDQSSSTQLTGEAPAASVAASYCRIHTAGLFPRLRLLALIIIALVLSSIWRARLFVLDSAHLRIRVPLAVAARENSIILHVLVLLAVVGRRLHLRLPAGVVPV